MLPGDAFDVQIDSSMLRDAEPGADDGAPADGDEQIDMLVDVRRDNGETEVLRFSVKKGETMASVTRRMSISMGLTPEQAAVLLGAGGGIVGTQYSPIRWNWPH